MEGVLIVDKPAGITSHDVVVAARRILQERRVGHTGTLDPFATGVLVMLIGRATRLAQFVSSAVKEYEAVIRLGYSTNTGDITGQPLSARPMRSGENRVLNEDLIEKAFKSLRGEIDQVPPMYSAKKRAGRKLYELARRGEEIEREAVRVFIHELELIEGQPVKDNQDGTWDCRVRVVCSAGTYIRTLAEDFGKLLGLGAHVSELRRVRVGDFRIDTANSLEELRRRVAEGSLARVLLPPDAALSTMPSMHLSMAEAERALRGVALAMASEPGEAWVGGERVRLRDPQGNLLAIAVYDQPRRLLRPYVVLVAENRR